MPYHYIYVSLQTEGHKGSPLRTFSKTERANTGRDYLSLLNNSYSENRNTFIDKMFWIIGNICVTAMFSTFLECPWHSWILLFYTFVCHVWLKQKEVFFPDNIMNQKTGGYKYIWASVHFSLKGLVFVMYDLHIYRVTNGEVLLVLLHTSMFCPSPNVMYKLQYYYSLLYFE